MAWITPIINWIASNAVTPTDFNRIEGNTLDLYTNKEDKSIVSTLATLVGTKVDKITGKGLSESDYTTVEKAKLGGIAIGAQVNAVTTVAGRTGAVVVAKADVGLGSVENYAKASQAEAEAGTSDIKYMTPLRVKQAIANIQVLGSGSANVAASNSQLISVTHNLGRHAIIQYWGSDLGGGNQNNYISVNNTTSFTITLKSSSGNVGSGVIYYEYW